MSVIFPIFTDSVRQTNSLTPTFLQEISIRSLKSGFVGFIFSIFYILRVAVVVEKKRRACDRSSTD